MKTLASVFAFLFISSLAFAGDYQIIRAYGATSGGGTGTNVCQMFVNQDVSGAELIEVFVWNLSVAGTVTVSRVLYNGVATNTVATLTNVANAVSTASISSANTIAKMWKDEDYFLFSGAGTNAFKCGTIMRGHKIVQ